MLKQEPKDVLARIGVFKLLLKYENSNFGANTTMTTSCIRVFTDGAHIEHSKQRLAAVEPDLESVAAVLALAGNGVRLKMMFLLLDQQHLCVCDLADVLQMNVSAISQHLRKLKDGGIVQARKVGQTVFYTLTPALRPMVEPLLASVFTSLPTVAV